MNIRCGCSGWHYADWRGLFYPAKLPPKRWLGFYSAEFSTVEINNTFYGSPSIKTFETWRSDTPEEFRFSVKGNRFITHLKKLHEVDEAVWRFYDSVKRLAEKLGPVLWQLPPGMEKDTVRLDRFCRTLSRDFQNVIEFRHRSWWNEEVYALLRKYEISMCAVSAPGLPEDIIDTADTAYIRFHGKSALWYRYDYDALELAKWAGRIGNLHASELYIYFNNDYDARAIKNCRQLEDLLAKGFRSNKNHTPRQ